MVPGKIQQSKEKQLWDARALQEALDFSLTLGFPTWAQSKAPRAPLCLRWHGGCRAPSRPSTAAGSRCQSRRELGPSLARLGSCSGGEPVPRLRQRPSRLPDAGAAQGLSLPAAGREPRRTDTARRASRRYLGVPGHENAPNPACPEPSAVRTDGRQQERGDEEGSCSEPGREADRRDGRGEAAGLRVRLSPSARSIARGPAARCPRAGEESARHGAAERRPGAPRRGRAHLGRLPGAGRRRRRRSPADGPGPGAASPGGVSAAAAATFGPSRPGGRGLRRPPPRRHGTARQRSEAADGCARPGVSSVPAPGLRPSLVVIDGGPRSPGEASSTFPLRLGSARCK